MIAHTLSLLALAAPTICVSSSSEQTHSQKGLGTDPPNFIQSSIYGRRDLLIQDLGEPLALAPTRLRQDFEDDYQYEGIVTFAHLNFTDCTKAENDKTFDIGIVGHPFDLGVTYRPGARFGPNGARQGARRISWASGWESVMSTRF